MKNIIFLKRKQRRNGDPRIKPQKPIDPDSQLLQLQEYYCEKIEQAEKAKDESLIKFYLGLTGKVARERLELRGGV